MSMRRMTETIMKPLAMSNRHKIGNEKSRGCDLGVMIRAFQALSPGSNPGIRISLPYLFFSVAGVAKHGQRRRT